MRLFRKQYQVKPNMIGFLYRNNALERQLAPGVYPVWDWKNRTELFVLPVTTRMTYITNQEALTKDNIALRYSFHVKYRISDGQMFLGKFALDMDIDTIIAYAEKQLRLIVQRYLLQKIVTSDSETLNESRGELWNFKTQEMENEALEYGITIEEAILGDFTFPKCIQDLFAKHLEAKIRARADLENARTTVATARTLKNASELMKGDDNIKFFQLIETISKIAEKGKHTFMIGDMKQIV